MHKLLVMDGTGHREVLFAPPEVKTKEACETRLIARMVFDEVMGRPGWTVIAQAPAGVKGATLTRFDPTVEEAIAIAPFVGG